MSRGRGAKSKIKGRISGYETADFTIVEPSLNSSVVNTNFQNAPPIYKSRNKMPLFHKVVIGIVVIIIFIFLIGKISDLSGYDSSYGTYKEPKVMTPETSSIKPTAFTQRQLDAQDARDKKIAEILKDGWTISNNEVPSDDYITVGKKWEAVRTNPSPVINVTTSFEYEPKDQKFESSTISLKLQETAENSGIKLDSTAQNLLNLYSPNINIDSINSSVQAAYNATTSSKPYQGSLSFDNDYVYITGEKSGRLISITINVNTSVSNF